MEKKQILDRWIRAPDTPYIVATTALAEGFDYPHVRFVMNIDAPESLVFFAQDSGRAGRDGKRACSMVLLPATWQPQLADGSSEEPYRTHNYRTDLGLRKRHDKEAAHRYLAGKQCYRTSLSDYLDVACHRRWCMPEDVPCDVCKVPHQDIIGPIEKAKQDETHTGLQLIQQEKLELNQSWRSRKALDYQKLRSIRRWIRKQLPKTLLIAG